jgi:hypothetical protein
MVKEEGWNWYAGADEECYTIGPCDTREQALQEALDSDVGYENEFDVCAVHLIEARKDPLQFSKFCGIDWLVDSAFENAEDNAYEVGNEYGDPIFDVSEADIRDFQRRLAEAMDEWQRANNLVFTGWAFTSTRNSELVVERRKD